MKQKRTVLVCDPCREPKRDAVASYELRNGRRVIPLDLCEKHRAMLERTYCRKRGKRGTTKAQQKWGDPSERLLGLIEKGCDTPSKLSKQTKIPPYAIYPALKKLIKDKKVKKTGHARSVHYHKV